MTSYEKQICLSLLITSVSGNYSLAFFLYHFFHFRRPPCLRLALDGLKGLGNLAAFTAKEVKSAVAQEIEEYSSAKGP